MKPVKNLPASIQARLRQHARITNRPYNEVAQYYVIERFLYRLSRSAYCNTFILKGGLAFFGWQISLRRPTRDIDFQAYAQNSQAALTRVIDEICCTMVEDDGLWFDTSSIVTLTIMNKAEYEGVRVKLQAHLGKSVFPVQIDISFGNIITPKPMLVAYPTLLGSPPFELKSYPQETAIAEKLQSIVMFGNLNGRLKDYYDIYLLAKECDFDGIQFTNALRATFEHRSTQIPTEPPAGLSNEFASDNQSEWSNLLLTCSPWSDEMGSFPTVIDFVRRFLLRPLFSAGEREEFRYHWVAGHDWVAC